MSALRDDAVYVGHIGDAIERIMWETATRDLPNLKEQLRGLP